MNSDVIAAIIGVATFFLTCLGNAIILGFFLGGLRAEVRMVGDRLAKIEGMFTLVPRRVDSDGKTLSVGMVFVGNSIPHL
jgi:hypothetical protein